MTDIATERGILVAKAGRGRFAGEGHRSRRLEVLVVLIPSVARSNGFMLLHKLGIGHRDVEELRESEVRIVWRGDNVVRGVAVNGSLGQAVRGVLALRRIRVHCAIAPRSEVSLSNETVHRHTLQNVHAHVEAMPRPGNAIVYWLGGDSEAPIRVIHVQRRVFCGHIDAITLQAPMGAHHHPLITASATHHAPAEVPIVHLGCPEADVQVSVEAEVHLCEEGAVHKQLLLFEAEPAISVFALSCTPGLEARAKSVWLMPRKSAFPPFGKVM